MMSILYHFIYMLFPTCGFCVLFRVPLKKFPACILIGALSWTCYQLFLYHGASAVLAAFAASCLVGLLSDIASRLLKEAATIFIIPGILCLVPGAGMYYTMLSLLHNDMTDAAENGVSTLMIAGAIAVGLLVMGSLIKIILMAIKGKPAH